MSNKKGRIDDPTHYYETDERVPCQQFIVNSAFVVIFPFSSCKTVTFVSIISILKSLSMGIKTIDTCRNSEMNFVWLPLTKKLVEWECQNLSSRAGQPRRWEHGGWLVDSFPQFSWVRERIKISSVDFFQKKTFLLFYWWWSKESLDISNIHIDRDVWCNTIVSKDFQDNIPWRLVSNWSHNNIKTKMDHTHTHTHKTHTTIPQKIESSKKTITNKLTMSHSATANAWRFPIFTCPYNGYEIQMPNSAES